MKPSVILLFILIGFIQKDIYGQQYTDLVQLHNGEKAIHVNDLISYEGNKYIIQTIPEFNFTGKVYFNDELKIDYLEELEAFPTAESRRLIVKMNSQHNYLDHTLVACPDRKIKDIKLIEGQIYCKTTGEHGYQILKYNYSGEIDILFEFPEDQSIFIDDFIVKNNKLLIVGHFNRNTPYIHYQQDTLWHGVEDAGSNSAYVYSIDLISNSIDYSLSYGGIYWYVLSDGVQLDNNGNAYIWGAHASAFSIQGDTSDYRGFGNAYTDAHLIRLAPDGTLIKLHSFASTADEDKVNSFWLDNNEEAYYAIFNSRGGTATYIDKEKDYDKTAPYSVYSTVYKFDALGNIQWSFPLKTSRGIANYIYGESPEHIYACVHLGSDFLPLIVDESAHPLEDPQMGEVHAFHYKIDKMTGEVIDISKPMRNQAGVRFTAGSVEDYLNTLVLKFDNSEVVIDSISHPQYVESYNINTLVNVDYITNTHDIGQANELDIFPTLLNSQSNINVLTDFEGDIDFKLFGLDGKLELSGTVKDNVINLANTKLADGIYYLRFEHEESITTKAIYIGN